MVFIDNFFINIKLLTALKGFNISKYKKTKAGFGFCLKLLKIRELSTKKNNWGIKIYITTTKNVFCFIWQDLETNQIMTTIHSTTDLNSSVFIFK